MQIHGRLGLLACVSVVLVVGFAACGVGNGALAPANGQDAGVTITGVASTVTSSKRTPVATTPTTPSAPSGTPSGKVTITLGAAHYAPSDTLAAAIDNGTATVISTADHQTECKYITLQRSVNGVWQTQRQCPLLSPTRMVQLAPGVTPQPLSPGSAPWPAGTYRIALSYFVGTDSATSTGSGSGPAATSSNIVYSTTFTIG